MIIVTGSITAKDGKVEEAWAFATEHVALSRVEPGCVSHDVYRDPDDDAKLFFFERWASLAALKTHFSVSAERGFNAKVGEVAAASEIHIYEATETRP